MNSKEKKPVMTEEDIMKLLDSCYEKCLNGIPKVSPSVEELANDYLKKHRTTEEACRAMLKNQIAKCTTSGVVTGFGGFITMPVAILANVGSVIYVQMRMIACVAYMADYELDSDQTQTFIYACLAGVAVNGLLKQAGIKIGVKFTNGLIKKIPGKVLTKINQKVGFRFITKFGTKGIVNLGKLLPGVGAIVGGGLDLVETKIIAERAYKTYIECKKELETYLHRENPFVVTNTSYRGSNLQLASVEDAWEELDIYITDELWSKFILLFYEVLIESEPIFDYPFEKHFEASIYAEKPEWSPTLKKGMIRTLIMRAYYRGHEENQKQIDNIVSRVLDTITSKERWGYISQYLTDLCEASPESVLRKLEDELKQPQGLLELFEANDGDFMTSRHYYTNVLWAVEQLVQQKKYVVRALEWLWKVDSYNLKYSISNSPKGVLDMTM